MGIIKAVTQAVGGAFADQWLEVIEADNMGDQTVFTKGTLIRRGENKKGTDNVVSNGSMIHVYDNQFRPQLLSGLLSGAGTAVHLSDPVRAGGTAGAGPGARCAHRGYAAALRLDGAAAGPQLGLSGSAAQLPDGGAGRYGIAAAPAGPPGQTVLQPPGAVQHGGGKACAPPRARIWISLLSSATAKFHSRRCFS